MKNNFWFYDPNERRAHFFATEAERDAYAAKALAVYHKEACDNEEWADDVFHVCCGVVTHTAQMINKETIPRPPADEIDEDGWDDEGNSWNDQQDEIVTFDVAMLPICLTSQEASHAVKETEFPRTPPTAHAIK